MSATETASFSSRLADHRDKLLRYAEERSRIAQRRRMRRAKNLLRGKLDKETLDAVERIVLGEMES